MQTLSCALTEATHADKFRTLLLCEEIQQQLDIRMYDIQDARLEPTPAGRLLKLYVPGLSEARPSVQKHDRVFARAPWLSATHEYEGVVHDVLIDHVQLRFHASFHAAFIPGVRCSIRFTGAAMHPRHAPAAALTVHLSLTRDYRCPQCGVRRCCCSTRR